MRRLVSEGIIEAKLLDRAPRQPGDDRLIRLVAGIAAAAHHTLQQIAAQLEAMRERTPRDGTRWHPSSSICSPELNRLGWPGPRQRKWTQGPGDKTHRWIGRSCRIARLRGKPLTSS